VIPLSEFRAEAAEFLAASGLPRRDDDEQVVWGVGQLDVSVFHNLTPEEETALIGELKAWQRRKFQARSPGRRSTAVAGCPPSTSTPSTSSSCATARRGRTRPSR